MNSKDKQLLDEIISTKNEIEYLQKKLESLQKKPMRLGKIVSVKDLKNLIDNAPDNLPILITGMYGAQTDEAELVIENGRLVISTDLYTG
jgi:hypothetical protein